MALLPVDRITIIRPEYFLGVQQLVGWPVRQTDRETQNAISASLGSENEYELHGRSVVGAGEAILEFRGRIISGKVVADVMSQMQDAWLLELVKVQEKETAKGMPQVPKTKVQCKFAGPETDMTGEPSSAKTVEFLSALRRQNLSVRGFWVNHYETCDFVQLILGPAIEKGAPANWKFCRGKTFLFIDF